MKHIMLSCALLCVAIFSSKAQMNTKVLGTARDETATHVRKLSDGSTIIAGLIYDINPGEPPVLDQSDLFVLRLDAAGNLLWSKTLSTNNNDFLQEMLITSNDDIVLVGNNRPGTSSTVNNTATIYRLDNSGMLLASKTFRDNNASNNAGDIFWGVTEVSNGNLVVVGTNNFQGYVSAGIICVYDASLNLQYHERYNIGGIGTGDELLSVVTDGTDIYITGFVGYNSKHDVRAIRYTPGTTSGTIVYDYRYDFNAGGAYDNNMGIDIYLQGSTLLISSIISSDCCAISNNKQSVLRLDAATGNVQDLRILTTPSSHANTTRIVPITNDRVFFTQNPAGLAFDPFAQGYIGTVDAVVGDLTLSTSTATTTKTFSNSGDQAITDIIDDGGILTMVGSINGATPSYGGRDIYLVNSAYTLQDDREECDIDDYTYTLSSVSVTQVDISVPATSLTYDEGEEVTIEDLDLNKEHICGTEIIDPGCTQECYWTLNGNSNVTSSHFVGSINNAELRFRTVNQERGIFDTDGDLGINLFSTGGSPDAKLHVFCDYSEQDTRGHSNVRFEELMSGDGDMLVIDANGYVYRAAFGAAMAQQEEQIASLESKIAQLEQQLNTLLRNSTDGPQAGSLKLFPNPASNEVNVEYNLGGKADNGTIVLTDATGKQIAIQDVEGNTGKVLIQIPATVVSGNLICTVVANGEVIASRTLIVNKK